MLVEPAFPPRISANTRTITHSMAIMISGLMVLASRRRIFCSCGFAGVAKRCEKTTRWTMRRAAKYHSMSQRSPALTPTLAPMAPVVVSVARMRCCPLRAPRWPCQRPRLGGQPIGLSLYQARARRMQATCPPASERWTHRAGSVSPVRRLAARRGHPSVVAGIRPQCAHAHACDSTPRQPTVSWCSSSATRCSSTGGWFFDSGAISMASFVLRASFSFFHSSLACTHAGSAVRRGRRPRT